MGKVRQPSKKGTGITCTHEQTHYAQRVNLHLLLGVHHPPGEMCKQT